MVCHHPAKRTTPAIISATNVTAVLPFDAAKHTWQPDTQAHAWQASEGMGRRHQNLFKHQSSAEDFRGGMYSTPTPVHTVCPPAA